MSTTPSRGRLMLIAALATVGLFSAACNGSSSDDAGANGDVSAATAAPASGEEESGDRTDEASWPLTAPAPALPVTVTDATGAEVTIERIDRIASLQGDITEILWTMGLGDNIAIVDATGLYPEEMTHKPQAGFFRQLNAEGILAEEPTVVLAHPGAGPPPVLDAIKAAGVPVVIVPETDETDVTTVGEKILFIGEAVGMADHAKALADQVQSQIDEAAELVAQADSSPVVAYVVPRGDQVFLSGLDSASNGILAAAGATTVAELLELETSVPLTPEALVAADPEYIVSTHTAVATGGGKEAFLSMQGIAQTTAAQKGNLLVFDDMYVQQFVPRTGQAIAELARVLHPELEG